MLTSKCVTTKPENKTRKHWLFSTFFILVFYPLIDLAISAISSVSSIPKEVLADFTVKIITGVIQTIFLWHCAYRNHGTKLLSFYLVALPLLLVISMVVSLADPGNVDTTTASDSCATYTITASLGALAAFFWWLVLSLKMKNVNKAIQEKMLEEKLNPS